MDAVPERDVVVDRAVDVEAVGVRVLAFVAPGRTGEQQHLRVRGHDLAVQLDVTRRPPTLDRRRRFEPQQLLDGVGDQRGVGCELGPLVAGCAARTTAALPSRRATVSVPALMMRLANVVASLGVSLRSRPVSSVISARTRSGEHVVLRVLRAVHQLLVTGSG